MKHIARKRFGQHFLSDAGIIDAIVREIAPQPGQPMVEIGPGLAALTQPLVERLGKLTVIELDRDLAARLRSHGQLNVIESDVLKVDFAQVAASLGAPKIRVVGNLPYNISTPILFHLLDCVGVIEDQHFMLQKEVIDRMVARPATSDYSRLSVMLQWRYAMDNVLFVPPESFEPPRAWTAPWCAWCRWPSRRWSTCACSASWCRWPSASGASCCAIRWASGWSKGLLPEPSTCSEGPRKYRCLSTSHSRSRSQSHLPALADQFRRLCKFRGTPPALECKGSSGKL
jgi:hypothetical protein